MVKGKPKDIPPSAAERRFYARTRAFGRFGMRIFAPITMERPHWHGHVEINFIRNGRMHYLVDAEKVIVEPDSPVVFWAGIPHQLVAVEQTGSAAPELGNIYLPLDAFLYMTHIPKLQVAILNGGTLEIDPGTLPWSTIQRWYADYRSGQPARADVVKMELNAVFRRMDLAAFSFLRKPWLHSAEPSTLASSHVRHVVAMVRFILDNIEKPLGNADVTAVTGLHTNYALAIFSKVMLLPLKQFIIRMRLLRARGLLLESDLAITTVAEESGFRSISQFYAHFSAAYGTSPQQLRLNFYAEKTG